ncbi:MAG: Hsp20/alpha crystallin family protein [Clostridiales bacterium]|jgi:HSP20 family molecular chaperone IbpA|nr:Hsp20/alpha crystallin family protein [Clostridiales bacterium]
MLLPSIFRNNFVDDFFDGFDDMFNFPSIARIPSSRWMTTNVRDLGDEYQLEIELPGYDKKDINATLDKGYLTISANREESKDETDKKGKYIRRERYSGSCKRSFYVGDNLDEKDFKASFDNGVLTIVFPKDKVVSTLEEKKQITIK